MTDYAQKSPRALVINLQVVVFRFLCRLHQCSACLMMVMQIDWRHVASNCQGHLAVGVGPTDSTPWPFRASFSLRSRIWEKPPPWPLGAQLHNLWRRIPWPGNYLWYLQVSKTSSEHGLGASKTIIDYKHKEALFWICVAGTIVVKTLS